MDSEKLQIDRRVIVGGVLIATLGPAATKFTASQATADESTLAKAAISRIENGRAMSRGRVRIQIPELAENGNTVGVTVAVESPMTLTDCVKTIHVVSERNPIADVVKFHLSPRAGRAQVSTNIRLASTQTVTAVAEMSDGTLWYGSANVIVTLAACVEGG